MKKLNRLFAALLSVCVPHAVYGTIITFTASIDVVSDPMSTFPTSIAVGEMIAFEIEYNAETAVRTGSMNSSSFLDGLDLQISIVADGNEQWILTDASSTDEISIESNVVGEQFNLESRGLTPALYPAFGGQFYFNLGISEFSRMLDIVDSADLPRTNSDLRIDQASGHGGNFFNLLPSGGFIADFVYTIDPNSFSIAPSSLSDFGLRSENSLDCARLFDHLRRISSYI